MSLAILFHFLCAQHVSDINISITRSLRLFCWITTLVVLFLVRCVLEFRCGWVGVVSVLQAEAHHTHHTHTILHSNALTLMLVWSTADNTYCAKLPTLQGPWCIQIFNSCISNLFEFNSFQQDATYSVYCISVGSSTGFGCWHPSSGAGTAVITASGID